MLGIGEVKCEEKRKTFFKQVKKRRQLLLRLPCYHDEWQKTKPRLSISSPGSFPL